MVKQSQGRRVERGVGVGDQMDDRTVSRRSERIRGAVPFRTMFGFRMHSGYAERRLEPGVLDFTFGDPHELQVPAHADALREAAVPRDALWFAYKQSEVAAQAAAAASLERVVPLGWGDTATAESVEAALPHFRDAFEAART